MEGNPYDPESIFSLGNSAISCSEIEVTKKMLLTKGQLISKCLFSSKKWMKTSCTVVKTNLFICFLEEFTTWQFAFEINWPLKSSPKITF